MIVNKNREFCIHLYLISLDISLENMMVLKTFNSEFSYIKVSFTDQNYKPLEVEDNINITLVIN